MQPGDVRTSLLLQPTGKVDSLLRVTCAAADRFVLDCDPGFGESTVARLSRFKIRVNADIELQRQTWRAVRTTSPVVDLAEIGQPLDVSGAISAWRSDGSAFDIFSPNMTMPPTLREGTHSEFEASRVRSLWPVMGVDISTEMIPAETCAPGAIVGDKVVVDSEIVGVYTTVAGVNALALIKRGVEICDPYGENQTL
jgi:folate-binding Fe-S cluster repair protein YgfZ